MNIETLLLSFDQINYNGIVDEQKTWNHTPLVVHMEYGVFTLSWSIYLSPIGSTSERHTWKLKRWDDNELENFSGSYMPTCYLPYEILDYGLVNFLGKLAIRQCM